ncbi:MAG TPA: DUF4349 domain-containing protein [Terriglobales bacterium]|jgi:hypothetical protein|nr:DUF4349 domain-containing protein [Terriglobales bacterium]
MNNHPVEQEELMAYLEGELAPDQAATAAAHLEHCRECQNVAGDLQSVSRRMMAWQAEPTDDLRMTQAIAAALEERRRAQEKPAMSAARSWRDVLRVPQFPRWAWVSGAVVAGLVVLLVVSTSNLTQPRIGRWVDVAHDMATAPITSRGRGTRQEAQTAKGPFLKPEARVQAGRVEKESSLTTLSPGTVADSNGLFHGLGDRAQNSFSVDGQPATETVAQAPMIVRTAGLSLTTKEFDKARVGMEEILKRHGGYMGQLDVSASSESGRSLTATLRVPSDQLDATLGELKKLGRVEGESQNGEEVTQQYVDLQARITNAQNTEAQLTDILRNRTGKLSDVLAVEEEISRVRGEIERMEAERKNLAHQVDFATVSTTLTEEYENQLQAVPVSTFTRIRNAAVEGYTSVTEGVISVVLFLFAYGPSILVLGALVFFPVRAVWRRWRRRMESRK